MEGGGGGVLVTGTCQFQGAAASWECSRRGACTQLSASPHAPMPASSCVLLRVPVPPQNPVTSKA